MNVINRIIILKIQNIMKPHLQQIAMMPKLGHPCNDIIIRYMHSDTQCMSSLLSSPPPPPQKPKQLLPSQTKKRWCWSSFDWGLLVMKPIQIRGGGNSKHLNKCWVWWFWPLMMMMKKKKTLKMTIPYFLTYWTANVPGRQWLRNWVTISEAQRVFAWTCFNLLKRKEALDGVSLPSN